MAPTDRLQSGFLVLADISGFTAFVTATELEHGAEVTGVLLAGVMEALAPPLEIQELEGDAVFALGPDDDETDRALMEAFSRAFEAFSERQREMALDTSCYCQACRGVLGLSLKLIVHHGSFMRQVVRGRSRLAGPDIILAHLFLKNDVEPRTYVLFTDAAVERLGIDPIAAGMERYTGRYAYFDERDCFVVSLDRFGRRGEGVGPEMLLGLRSFLGDLTLGADPGAENDLRSVVAA
ncbi:MAG: hypothetical protein DMD87_25835 [Candidatus Rokuibacteriota bacterium]|nr:MAG: hypothetical protein DMD87_25835 [Candidatus Rokubacteria bacterium]